MAIIIEGQSTCPICGKELLEDYLVFPNLTSNTRDAMFLFSDCGIHISCLDHHPLKEMALYFKQKYSDLVSEFGQLADPQNAIVFGLLTSDTQEELYRFNFQIVRNSSLPSWTDRQVLIKTGTEYLEAGKWISSSESFHYLKYLLDKVKLADV